MQNLTPVPLAVPLHVFKRAVNILFEDDADDAALTDRLVAAQAVVETAAGRPLGVRSMAFPLRAMGWRRWWVPIAPIVSLTALEAQADDGTWAALDLTQVRLECGADEPQIVLRNGVAGLAGVADGQALRLTAQAGHAVGAIPGQLTQAIILTAKEWYEAGVTPMVDSFRVGGAQPPALSFAVHALIRQVRYRRPHDMAVC